MFLRTVYILLAILALVLLQGILSLNGGTDAIMTHAKEGRFSNGKKLHHVYTGYPLIDDVLPMSVSMWDPVLHQARATTLLSRSFSASVQSLAVFAMIESQRRGCKHLVLRWAPVNILTWQLLGAAIFIPFYFMLELEQQFFPSGQHVAQDPSLPHLRAKALLPATILTVLHLYRMVYFPPSGITSSQHQAWMAAWQLAPFFCYCAMAGIVSYLSTSEIKKTTVSPRSRNSDAIWVKAILVFYGIFSAAMHLAVLWELVYSKDVSVSHEATFVPQHKKLGHPNTANFLFDEERKYFLQWDYLIIVIGAAIYVTVILDRICTGFSRAQKVVIFVAATFACHMFSFGFVLSVVLYLREGVLRSQVAFSTEEETLAAEKPAK
ncbi:hypothetical protein B0J11DRAFT_503017 [Dendryphion nanum]|uniref:Uncharacterized protein n=1 Tax=Dendryphion nanum TaxID=256645 RepID=A0A9P9ISM8_9PLEO|nr:hypothetical protein B0J11DRAFT_503017 [Dendryphion nanum]